MQANKQLCSCLWRRVGGVTGSKGDTVAEPPVFTVLWPALFTVLFPQPTLLILLYLSKVLPLQTTAILLPPSILQGHHTNNTTHNHRIILPCRRPTFSASLRNSNILTPPKLSSRGNSSIWTTTRNCVFSKSISPKNFSDLSQNMETKLLLGSELHERKSEIPPHHRHGYFSFFYCMCKPLVIPINRIKSSSVLTSHHWGPVAINFHIVFHDLVVVEKVFSSSDHHRNCMTTQARPVTLSEGAQNLHTGETIKGCEDYFRSGPNLPVWEPMRKF